MRVRTGLLSSGVSDPTTARLTSLHPAQLIDVLLITELCRAGPGKLLEFLEQLLIYLFEVKTRLALHALLQFRGHPLQQLGAGVNRHQIETDIRFAAAKRMSVSI